jgi:hypothetical protein
MVCRQTFRDPDWGRVARHPPRAVGEHSRNCRGDGLFDGDIESSCEFGLMREVFPVENEVDGDRSAVTAGADRENPFVVGEKSNVEDVGGQR